jgi:hypothetical protein
MNRVIVYLQFNDYFGPFNKLRDRKGTIQRFNDSTILRFNNHCEAITQKSPFKIALMASGAFEDDIHKNLPHINDIRNKRAALDAHV